MIPITAMIQSRRFFAAFFCSALLFGPIHRVFAEPNSHSSLIVRAVQAYSLKDTRTLASLLPSLADNILEPYFVARAVNVGEVSTEHLSADVSLKLKTFQGSPPIEKLRVVLLKQWATSANWTLFEQHIDLVPEWLSDGDTELACASWLFANHQKQLSHDNAIILFRHVSEFSPLCGSALSEMLRTGDISIVDAWDKAAQFAVLRKKAEALSFVDALRLRHTTLPRSVISTLPKGIRSGSERLFDAVLESRESFRAGKQHLEQLKGSVDQKSYRLTAIYVGAIGARKQEHSAHALIQSVDGYRYSESSLPQPIAAWRTRAAIWAKSWPDVQSSIETMDDDIKAESVWKYWLGQALKSSSRKKSVAVFEELANRPDYYGVLASEEIGKRPFHGLSTSVADPALIREISTRSELVRIKALYKVGLWIEGALEWNLIVRRMGSKHYFAAAMVAKDMGFLDRQISFAERANEHFDMHLRCPLAFFDDVMDSASMIGIEPEWVWSVMKQESRFVTNAVSIAGARGLMQLMPATARKRAQAIGLASGFPDHRLTDPKFNMLLGAAELRQLMDKYDNDSFLAVAAYNAGAGNASRWAARLGRVDRVTFTELIPFDETRDYVKRVHLNYVMYSILLGTGLPPKLSALVAVSSQKSENL